MAIRTITIEYGIGAIKFFAPKEEISVTGDITVIGPSMIDDVKYAIVTSQTRTIEISMCDISEQQAFALLEEKKPIEVYSDTVKDVERIIISEYVRNENNVITLTGVIV